MRTSFNRRSATKIRDGRVQRKNRHRPTTHERCVIDSFSPGKGFRHVLSKSDIRAFIDIIPGWDRFSERLEHITLVKHGNDCDGMYEFFHREESGAIYLHAWHEDLWVELRFGYFDAHRHIFERIDVACQHVEDEEGPTVICRFTEAQARAYMLLHIFMHELGHHYDRIHQKHLGSSKGEDYAEHFANSRFEQLFPAYVEVFGHPGRSA